MQAYDICDHDHSSGSGCSDLSALENETDTLGRAIIRHERDARRMQAVLNGSSRPLTRAPRTSASQRLQMLSRNGQEELPRAREQKLGPVIDQEVPQSAGRTWGRTQRPERRWTHHEPVVKEEAQSQETVSRRTSTDDDDDRIAPYRTLYTGDDLLGQDTPPSMRRARPPSEPSSLRHMNSSIVGDGLEAPTPVRGLANSTTNRFSRSRSAGLDQDIARPAANRRTIDLRSDPIEDKENLPQAKPAFPPQPELRARRLHDRKLEEDFRSSHARNDSMQLLKRLAKVTSMSPVQEKTKDLSEPAIDVAKQARNASARMEQVAAQLAGVQDLPATPVITGGWVDTPKQETKQEIIKIEQETPTLNRLTEPKQVTLPRDLSAATEVLKIAQASEHSAVPLEILPRPLSTQATEVHEQPLSETPQLSGSVAEALTSASSPRRRGGLATKSQDTTRRPKQVTFDLDGRTICEHCGGGYSNAWEALWVELRNNFLVRDHTSSTGFRLTWLGAAALAWLLWYAIETAMCKLYCSPFFSLQMHGYGARPGAPEYPLVTPQVLLQPFEPVWRPLGRSLATVSGVTFNWAFGEGSPDYTTPARLVRRPSQSVLEGSALQATKTLGARWAETVSSLAKTSTRRALASVVNAIDEMAQMWDA